MVKLVRTINVLSAAALATAATAAPVLGQGFDIRSLFNRAPAPAASGASAVVVLALLVFLRVG